MPKIWHLLYLLKYFLKIKINLTFNENELPINTSTCFNISLATHIDELFCSSNSSLSSAKALCTSQQIQVGDH